MSGDVADNRQEPRAAGSTGTSIAVLYVRARNWAIGSGGQFVIQARGSGAGARTEVGDRRSCPDVEVTRRNGP